MQEWVVVEVVRAAWSASGRPRVLCPARWGDCARCGELGVELVATSTVVSRTFTGFDGWAQPSAWGLCMACCWAYRGTGLRTIGLVTRRPRWRTVTRRVAGEVLTAALPHDMALIIPLRGRKHPLPSAVWGRVTVDDAQLSWTVRDADRLRVVQRLRSQGFGPRMLAAPSPPWPVLRGLPEEAWVSVLAGWESLAVWRRNRPWFDVAMVVTSKGGGGGE